MTLTARIGAAPMSGYQWLIVALCTFMNCLDGFDVMAVAFTGPSVTEEFGLNGSQFGLLVSVGLIGMALGSMLLAPFADLIGRRPMILISLVLGTIGMFGAAMAPSVMVMGIFRLVTGIGVGGILASTNVIASEFSNTKNRGLAIGIYTAGYGIGATLASLVAKTTVGGDWRIVFYAGGFGTLLALIVIAVLLPESIAFLEQRRPSGALERINRTLARMGMDAISTPDLDQASSARKDTGQDVYNHAEPVTLVTRHRLDCAAFKDSFGITGRLAQIIDTPSCRDGFILHAGDQYFAKGYGPGGHVEDDRPKPAGRNGDAQRIIS